MRALRRSEVLKYLTPHNHRVGCGDLSHPNASASQGVCLLAQEAFYLTYFYFSFVCSNLINTDFQQQKQTRVVEGVRRVFGKG